MKNFKLAKRGFTLIETVLVLAIGLGLIVGGIVFFQQAQASSDLTDKTRSAVGISSEVRSQYRTAANFGAADADIKEDVMTSSSIPEAQFNNVAIAVGADPQEFVLTFSALNEKVCNRMASSDLGPNSASDDADCANGNLAVTYSR